MMTPLTLVVAFAVSQVLPDAGAIDTDAGSMMPDGGCDASSGSAGAFTFATSPPSTADCQSLLLYDVAVTQGPAELSLVEAPAGARLVTTGQASASLDWTPSAEEAGDVLVDIAARQGSAVIRQRFRVSVECPNLEARRSGCESGLGAPLGLVMLGFLLALRPRRTHQG
jgi:hypothetical protein